MDTSNVGVGLFGAGVCLWHSILHQLYRHLLSCLQGHPIRNDGCGDVHLHLCHFAVDIDWHSGRSEFRWTTRFSVSRECRSTANSREEVVHGTGCDHPSGRSVAFRIDLHRNVFHLHLVLGLQNLLCIRIHAAGLYHFDYCHRLCHHRVHIFPIERRGLPMAMD